MIGCPNPHARALDDSFCFVQDEARPSLATGTISDVDHATIMRKYPARDRDLRTCREELPIHRSGRAAA